MTTVTGQRIWLATGSAGLGAVLLALGPLVGVTGAAAPPGFTSWPLLALLSFLPVLLAIGLVRGNRPAAASALLVVLALAGLGRLLADLQLLVDPNLLSRPELLVATGVSQLHAGAGTWLLLAGHVLTIAAGVLAVDPAIERDTSREPRRGLVLLTLLPSVGALGLLFAPYTSDNPYLPGIGALGAPALVSVGSLVITVIVVVCAVVSASNRDAETSQGGLLGAGLVLLALCVPALASALLVPGLHPAAGPVVVLVAAALFLALGATVDHLPDPGLGAARLPAGRGLYVTAGVLGVLAGLLAWLGARLPQVELPATGPSPTPVPPDLSASAATPSTGSLVLAGALVAALACTQFAGAVANTCRPAFAVLCLLVPLAGIGVLDASAESITALNSLYRTSAQSGPGALVIWLAAFLAVAAAVVAAVAGAVERDEVGEQVETAPGAVPVAAVALAGLLAVLAFALPTVSAPDYQAPGLVTNVRLFAFSGLLLGVLTICAAAVLALRSRPARASALLLGAAGVAGLRALDYPFTASGVPGAGAGVGTWLALGCAFVLVLAVFAVRSGGLRSEHRDGLHAHGD
ncbi:hypothetical protein BC739_008682 [Kutzneria viridogrisea]|uniref:Uncharacterized protein n=1 Tax=Kutzneria viridogrisea TaxID=47990 RepID=A0ABR6BX65_9PSEU|nr:hypothetical protein [Kutzneria viridogrisea]